MADELSGVKFSEIDCCPKIMRRPVCDTLDFRYRLSFQKNVVVVLHFRLERYSGSIVMGDPVYSTTLLPGEIVRIFSSDRHNRWSYDSESSLAYRHETTSEESFYSAGMAQAMSDLTINESGLTTSNYDESWAEGGGGVSFSFLGFEIGGGGSGGSYDSQSARAFCRNLSRHAECASAYVAATVRSKSAISVGEVEQRSHAQGESEAHYESSSRVFKNPNKCHAVTYIFYKLNKLQHISFKLVAVERWLDDPKKPVGISQRIPIDISGRVTVLPKSISATSKNRLEVENMARESAKLRWQSTQQFNKGDLYINPTLRTSTMTSSKLSIDLAERDEALASVDRELVEAGILDKEKLQPSKKIVEELSWEREEILPTPGVIVKGCLDKCDTCEPALQEEIQIDIERKHLENELLKKQIDLLEKSQEYRCCPAGSEEQQPPEDV